MNHTIRIYLLLILLFISTSAAFSQWNLNGNNESAGSLAIGGKLDVQVQGDGLELIRFSSERAWAFQQEGTSISTSLVLKDLTGNKFFKIKGYNNEEAFSIQSSTGNASFRGNLAVLGNSTISKSLVIGGGQLAGTPTLSVNNTWSGYSLNPEDNRPFTIRRHRNDDEAVQTFLQDAEVHNIYNNDEFQSSILFRIRNNDIEGANTGAKANDNIILKLTGNPQGPKVSIGNITTPDGYALGVDGKILSEEVVVKLSENWPDYVFDEDYSLMPLTELSEFLKKNKHLPEVPSADEVERNGQSLGKMNKLLLKKVEELTLYILQQQDQINNLTREVQQLKYQQEEGLKN